VHQAKVKYTGHAFNKTAMYKQKSRNPFDGAHRGFRIGDKKGRREDDLLDTFCYGVVLDLEIAMGSRV
jgi:hypothetical protein